ncbi:hypothetical protein [Pseudomonas cichorii]|uniref:hypothetical protein n=1 Tax=Pseudomonas cichorii TaxID=36746 RepID=UPI0019106A62|nr:hypothetical protein [Pseudomonas cichorii]
MSDVLVEELNVSGFLSIYTLYLLGFMAFYGVFDCVVAGVDEAVSVGRPHKKIRWRKRRYFQGYDYLSDKLDKCRCLGEWASQVLSGVMIRPIADLALVVSDK